MGLASHKLDGATNVGADIDDKHNSLIDALLSVFDIDSNVQTYSTTPKMDAIAEATDDTGVTVDGCLIKDGAAAAVAATAVDDSTIEVSSGKLRVKDLGSSLATNGYFKFPNGLIIQWGYSAASSSTMTVNFPIAFPTACLNVTFGNRKDGDTGGVDMSGALRSAPGTSSMSVSVYTSNTGFYWMAIGY